jgi:nitrite reductase/ring-hydroxylating ferredoxin subunit
VSRNQISVDHRYAGAGKWKEIRVTDPDKRAVLVAGMNELAVNQMKLVRTPHGRIVLARTESGWVAFDDHCTHRGGSLADGVMICGTVQCPWHGSQFDAATGAVKAGPAKEPISTYSVEQRSDGIYLKGRSISKEGS